jgi:hypothetical protein
MRGGQVYGIFTEVDSESSKPRDHTWAMNPVGDLNERLVLPERETERVSTLERMLIFLSIYSSIEYLFICI